MFWKSKKNEKTEEEFDKNLTYFVEEMGDSSVSKGFLLISGFVLFLSLLFAMLFSNVAVFLYDKLGGFTSKPVVIMLFVPFLAGFVFAYSIFRAKFPDMEENKMLKSDLMASMDYQNDSNKRWFLWISAILAGLLAVALLIFISGFFNSNGFYLFEI